MNTNLKNYLNSIKSRDKYFEDFESFCFAPFIKVIVWARRVWKSFFLFENIKKLLENQILKENEIFYINKEWIEFDEIKDYKDLNNVFEKWKKENNIKSKFFIWIDEIQEIKDWQKFILSVWSSFPESIIYITWSNSKLLSKDIWTNLRWRYISKKIYPLSLDEFMQFKNQKLSDDLFFEYINYGWLPAVSMIENENIKNEYLKWVYNTIFVKDLLEYANVRNPSLLKVIHKYLFKEVWNLINWKNIANFLKNKNIKTSVETILNYMEFSFDSYLLDEVLRYDIRWKKIFEITKKVYAFDLWIRNSLVWINLKNDINGILENLVYNYLVMNWYDVKVWILYDKEIDFVAEKNGDKKYIQVCYLLSSEKVIEREFGNLMKIKDNYEKIVVSYDNLFTNNYEWVKHLNIKKFLTS